MRPVPLIAVALAVLATGCGSGDDATAPGLRDSVNLIVSDASPASDDPTTYAYASLPFGAIPGGAEATVRNRATGAEVRAPIIDGAVDPVRLPGATGDTVELTAVDSSGMEFDFLGSIKPKAPPVVVRSSPGMRATDAPSLLRVSIVFSEPVTAATVNASTVALTLREQPVPGRLELSEGDLVALFVPDDSLVPGGTYTIVVSRGVRDRSGDALAEEYRAEFTVAAPTGTMHRVRVGVGGHLLHLRAVCRWRGVLLGTRREGTARLRWIRGSALADRGQPLVARCGFGGRAADDVRRHANLTPALLGQSV